MMPQDGFLSEFWIHLLTLVGAIGFVLTAIGTWLAWQQLRKTANAANAAARAFHESRKLYNRMVASQSIKVLAEARIHVRSQAWLGAAIRLGDLADSMVSFAEAQPDWQDFVTAIKALEQSFSRIDRGEIQYRGILVSQWNDLDARLTLIFTELASPF